MTLSVTLQLNTDVMQTAISLAGTLFTMASFVVNCLMLKQMTR